MNLAEILKENKGNLTVLLGAGSTIALSGDSRLSWPGLLQALIEERLRGSTLQFDLSVVRTLIEQGKFLDAADKLIFYYGGVNSISFGRAIRALLDLKVENSALGGELLRLRDHGATFVTTNYDTLADQILDLYPADPTTPRLVDYALGRQPGVVHLHGHIRNLPHIVLTTDAYKHAYDAVGDFLRIVFSSRTIITIGVGSTLNDPTFSRLFEWLSAPDAPVTPNIYAIFSEQDRAVIDAAELERRGITLLFFDGPPSGLAKFLRTALDVAIGPAPQMLSLEDRERYLASQGFHRVATQRPDSDVSLESTKQYLLGFTPTLARVGQTLIPRRREVGSIVVESGSTLQDVGKTKVFALTGAVGEGKSTTMLQAVNELAGAYPTYLSSSANTAIEYGAFMQALPPDGPLVIAYDEGASFLKSLLPFIHQREQTGASTVILIAAKTADWRSVFRTDAEIRHAVDIEHITIAGLDEALAAGIIAAWRTTQIECELLSGKSEDAALAKKLTRAAKTNRQAGRNETSLLTALLNVLQQNELPRRLRRLIDDVSERTEAHLGDALAIISAFHSLGIDDLPPQALAAGLGVDIARVRQDVLPALFREAWVSSGETLAMRSQLIATYVRDYWNELHPERNTDQWIADTIIATHHEALMRPPAGHYAQDLVTKRIYKLIYKTLRLIPIEQSLALTASLMAENPSDDIMALLHARNLTRKELTVEFFEFLRANSRLGSLRAAQSLAARCFVYESQPRSAMLMAVSALSDIAQSSRSRFRGEIIEAFDYAQQALVSLIFNNPDFADDFGPALVSIADFLHMRVLPSEQSFESVRRVRNAIPDMFEAAPRGFSDAFSNAYQKYASDVEKLRELAPYMTIPTSVSFQRVLEFESYPPWTEYEE